MRPRDGICNREMWERDKDKGGKPSEQVLIGYICVLFFILFSVGARQPLPQEKQWWCDGCGPQRGIDYASSDPGVDSGCSRKRLCLKKRSKCSPSQFYLGMWCLCAVCVCIHTFLLTLRDQPWDWKAVWGKDSLWLCLQSALSASPAMSATSPPATNFYQLLVQISILSVHHVNTTAACNDIQQQS